MGLEDLITVLVDSIESGEHIGFFFESGGSIAYEKKRFEEEPQKYLTELLTTHEKYYAGLKEFAASVQQNSCMYSDSQRALEERLRLFGRPPWFQLAWVRFTANISSLLKSGKSAKKELADTSTQRKNIDISEMRDTAVQAGIAFFQNRYRSEYQALLDPLLDVMRNISVLHKDIVLREKRSMEVFTAFYNAVYD